MAYDVDVLHQVMTTHDITVKQLAARSGIATKSIYKYLASDRTLPSDVLKAAFSLTCDLRLVALITGDMPLDITVHGGSNGERIPQAIRVRPLADTFDPTVDAMRSLGECVKHLRDTFADGKIDAKDLSSLDEIMRLNLETQAALAANFASARAERTRIEQCQHQ